IQSFGSWGRQLIAESTGKEGKGLVPVADEALGSSEVYGNDRLFVRLEVQAPSPTLPRERGREEDAWDRLAQAGHPVVTLKLQDPLAPGAEFFRWGYAIAVAGASPRFNAVAQP